MLSHDDYSKVVVEKLSVNHIINDFDCGDDDINNFLKFDALKWQSEQLATTYVFRCGGEIIGFFCSSADAITLHNDEKVTEGKLNLKHITNFPAIKIGRLGRSIKHKNCGVGEFILTWAIGHAYILSASMGIRFITIDAYPLKASWYEGFGFVKNINKEYKNKRNISMRLSLLDKELKR